MEQKIRQLKRWKQQHHKTLIITAAIIFLIAAFAFFVLNGKSGTIPESKAGGNNAVQETSLEGDGEEMKESATSKVFVDIAGAVKKPGVYEVDANVRMFEVVDKAGGLTKEADTSLMNLAERVSDGMKIVIPSKGTAVSNAPDQYSVPGQSGSGGSSDGNAARSSSSGGLGSQNSDLVNINQADLLQLQKINGVGPVTAEAIKAYREEHGLFQKKEDLKKVRGIGDKTFEKIKDHITL
ncbi:MAG: helix-hairpin-helix domain-containing protein [Eubacterium sp.]